MTKRFLLLGAGASAASDFHLPTMAGFFGKRTESSGGLEKQLKMLFGTPRKTWNLEEVLATTWLERIAAAKWGPRFNDGRARSLEDELVLTLRTKLAIGPGMCSLHRRLVDAISEDDTIATVNYDLILDSTLMPRSESAVSRSDGGRLEFLHRFVGSPTQYVGGPATTVVRWNDAWHFSFRGGVADPMGQRGLFIKLHGSLDWYRCPSFACRSHDQAYISKTPPAGADCLCAECGASMAPFLVPPGALDAVATTSRYALLWRLAFEELVLSDEIHVLGLSFAAGDFELQWLIRAALSARRRDIARPKIRLLTMNTKDEGHRAAERVVGARSLRFDSFEKYLDALSTGPPSM